VTFDSNIMAPPEDPQPPRSRAHVPLIRRYEVIAQMSRAMLAAARANNWDEVAEINDICRVMIEELKASAAREALSADESRRRVQALRSILADDAEIRARAEPWLRQLETLIVPRARPGASSAPGDSG
jgi:flagellar protein FliT